MHLKLKAALTRLRRTTREVAVAETVRSELGASTVGAQRFDGVALVQRIVWCRAMSTSGRCLEAVRNVLIHTTSATQPKVLGDGLEMPRTSSTWTATRTQFEAARAHVKLLVTRSRRTKSREAQGAQ